MKFGREKRYWVCKVTDLIAVSLVPSRHGRAGQRWYALLGCAQSLLIQLFWTKWNRAER